MPDPIKGSPEERQLRAEFIESQRLRRRQEREWDEMFAAGGRTAGTREAELTANIESMRQQLAEAQKELVELDKDETPTRPPLPGPEVVFNSADEAAAAAGPWSPEFAAWREAHVAPSSKGLF
jgi:seryl-tRNA synthetase